MREKTKQLCLNLCYRRQTMSEPKTAGWSSPNYGYSDQLYSLISPEETGCSAAGALGASHQKDFLRNCFIFWQCRKEWKNVLYEVHT